MEDKYAIDYHKLMFHPGRLDRWQKAQNAWQEAKIFYPIYVEIGISEICNHRCKFCALDYLGYRGGFADFNKLKRTIRDMARGGVKSINFSGEGEPLLNPKVKEFIQHAKVLGIDVALTTNGTFLKEELLKAILPHLAWIKVSIDAAAPETHLKIHRPKVQDFGVIMSNLRKAVEIRKKIKAKCTLGGQMILLPENFKEAIILAKQLKKIGFDYLIIKPYSRHKKSITREYENISYEKYFYLKDKLEKLNSDKFRVIFREKTMRKLGESRGYKTCNAVPFFWAHLTAKGDIYSCGNFIGDKRFKLGNYNKASFKEVWQGEKRKKHWKFVRTKLDIRRCRQNCRMDEVNKYLEKLKNPPEHVNFI